MAKKDLGDLLMGGTPPLDEASETAPPPEPKEKSGGVSMLALVLVLVVALAGSASLGYFLKQAYSQLTAIDDRLGRIDQTLQLVGRRLDGNSDQISTLESQLQVTMERVGVTQRELNRARARADELKKEQQQHVAALTQEIERKANLEKVAELAQESTQRFDGVDREISEVKEDVSSTREELMSTIQELSDLGVTVNEQGQMIATNLDGVEELRRRGERDYVTFELKRKDRKRVAGVTLELMDTDGDPLDADLRIFANDIMVERKDIPQNVPVALYVGTERIPYELVLNEISNKPDRISGYLSAPKGKLSDGPLELSTSR